jgi:hypothetical protein
MRMLRSRDDLEILDALPRYYPRWCRAVLRVPGVREIATWNLLVVMRRTVDRETAAVTADRAAWAALS